MEQSASTSIAVTLGGHRMEIRASDAESVLLEVQPERVKKHAVRIRSTLIPVKQALEVVSGVRRSSFRSAEARRILSTLGFEIATTGAAESIAESSGRTGDGRSGANGMQGINSPALPEVTTDADLAEHAIQSKLVSWLVSQGWNITRVANTSTKEHGIDVIAEFEDQVVAIEVKGYPSRTYADPARAGEIKRASPSTQSAHWFGQAVLAAMRTRSKHPTYRSVIALPDHPRYRALHAETAGSLAAAQIELWWVSAGSEIVNVPNEPG